MKHVCAMKNICCLALIPQTVDVFSFTFRVFSLAYTADAFQIVTGGSGCDDYTTDLSGLVSVPGPGNGYFDINM